MANYGVSRRNQGIDQWRDMSPVVGHTSIMAARTTSDRLARIERVAAVWPISTADTEGGRSLQLTNTLPVSAHPWRSAHRVVLRCVRSFPVPSLDPSDEAMHQFMELELGRNVRDIGGPSPAGSQTMRLAADAAARAGRPGAGLTTDTRRPYPVNDF